MKWTIDELGAIARKYKKEEISLSKFCELLNERLDESESQLEKELAELRGENQKLREAERTRTIDMCDYAEKASSLQSELQQAREALKGLLLVIESEKKGGFAAVLDFKLITKAKAILNPIKINQHDTSKGV